MAKASGLCEQAAEQESRHHHNYNAKRLKAGGPGQDQSTWGSRARPEHLGQPAQTRAPGAAGPGHSTWGSHARREGGQVTGVTVTARGQE
ncbi:hypothetical protein NHX12_001403 [Muraenolepis orangiensis]|uniref:Uncharacterized protein n=1 Tax=Muraenolepis orangiensis TaxID=630683 RepID=A0A9Q0E4G4_9TELE|nr:hypothetical protein NHX12_001403 [Muraenolepis orangiensis]